MPASTFIYCLRDPITNLPRYIGKANDPFKRMKGHLRDAKYRRSHREKWIAALLDKGLRPMLEVLDEVPNELWETYERDYVAGFRMLGFPLVNGTDGGDGISNPSLAVRQKISVTKTGSRASAETKAKMSRSQTGRRHTDESREKMNRVQAGRTFSDEARAKISQTLTGKKQSEETRRKRGLALSGAGNGNYGKTFSAETRQKIRDSLIEWNRKRKALIEVP